MIKSSNVFKLVRAQYIHPEFLSVMSQIQQMFEDSIHPKYVFKLNKQLYVLKQAPRAL